jgi:SdpC family antimicrobial peptide
MKTTSTIATVVALAGVAGTVFGAVSVPSVANAAPTPSASLKYNDQDVTDALLFATGRIVADHPELTKTLNPSGKLVPLTPADRATALSQLKGVDPQYHEIVTKGVQANDPFKAQAAVDRVNDDVKKRIEQVRGTTTPGVEPRDFAWQRDNILAYNNAVGVQNALGVWQVAVAHTVAAGAEAVIVLVIAPAVVSYQFDKNSDPIAQRETVAALTRAAGSGQ